MLLLSLLMLFAGPLLYQWIQRGGWFARTLDRTIVVLLVLIISLFLIPEIIEPLGWRAPVLMLAGYALPGMLENTVKRAAETFHIMSLYLALAGLLLHALLDGAGLAGASMGAGTGLATAIILHRFGVGLMLWIIMQPAFGKRIAWLTLFGLAGATVLGFEFSERVLPLAGEQAVSLIQAVIIGTIIHSLLHREHVHRRRGEN
jgi:membrane protein YdbS with pleckstrin-like domain